MHLSGYIDVCVFMIILISMHIYGYIDVYVSTFTWLYRWLCIHMVIWMSMYLYDYFDRQMYIQQQPLTGNTACRLETKKH